MDDHSEPAIARGLRAGDVRAWSGLYEAYAAKVWRTAARLIGEETGQVGDVVQETFLAAARSARGYDPRRGSLWAWLSGIARHQVALHYRRRTQARELTRALAWWRSLDGRSVEALRAESLAPAELLESRELATLVRHALARLPAEYQTMLLQKYVDGASVEEVARDFGCSEVAVRSKLARARKAFRRAFRRIVPSAGERGVP